MDMFNYFNNLNNDKSHFVNSNDICTPMECVKEMVDTIPEDFWKNEKLKILDPCCGNGNFPAYISTKTNINNIQFNEINPKRIDNVKKYFGEVNITTKDFLKEDFDKDYDLIVANPPFALFTEGKRTAKNHNVSKLFINKSLSLLKDNGYLLYIIPDNFMSLADSNDTFKELSKYDLLYINIHGAKKYFPKVGSSFVYFLLRKSNTKGLKTKVDNFYGKRNTSMVEIKNRNYLPLFFTEEVKSIFEKTIDNNGDKLNVETSSDLHAYTKKSLLSNVKDNEHPYKVIHTKIQTKWSKRPHKYQDGYKCFICLTSYFDTFVDNCGMTQSIGFVRTNSKEEAERIAKLLKHPLFLFINNVCRYGNFNNIRILQKLPYPKTDNLYKEFNITDKEISFIEDYLKNS